MRKSFGKEKLRLTKTGGGQKNRKQRDSFEGGGSHGVCRAEDGKKGGKKEWRKQKNQRFAFGFPWGGGGGEGWKVLKNGLKIDRGRKVTESKVGVQGMQAGGGMQRKKEEDKKELVE